MARTNLHELANRLLERLVAAADNHTFEGKLRQVAAEAGLNSVRSADAVKLLEDSKRIEVVERGRRGRDTIIHILSEEAVSLQDAEAMLPSKSGRRSSRLNYEDIGRAVVDRLLELARDDGLRAAQVEAFAREAAGYRERLEELEGRLSDAGHQETDLRIKLKAAEESLSRAEENLRRAVEGGAATVGTVTPVDDEDAQALLDVLRNRRA
jgi:hypothetical protein